MRTFSLREKVPVVCSYEKVPVVCSLQGTPVLLNMYSYILIDYEIILVDYGVKEKQHQPHLKLWVEWNLFGKRSVNIVYELGC